jgi:hypothetical protein
VVEFLIGPPAFIPDAGLLRQDLVHGSLKGRHSLTGVDFSEEPSDKRLVGFDEAKESVRVLLVMAAADPEAKGFVGHGDYPAPILGDGFPGVKSLAAELVPM